MFDTSFIPQLSSIPPQFAAPLAGGVALLTYLRLTSRRSSLPPGPAPLPLFGNYFSVPKGEQWLEYEKWGRDKGWDIVHMKIFGQDVLVINSPEAIMELFEKKGALYSDRPHMAMLNDLIGLNWHFGFMPYEEDWKNNRKVFTSQYSPSQAQRSRPQTLKSTRLLLRNLLDKPDDFMEHVQYWASGIALKDTYGLDVQPSGTPDPFIGAAKEAVAALIYSGLFGSYTVDYLPFLKHVPSWFPFAGFKKQASQWRTSVDIAGTVPFSIIKQAMADGKAEPCVATALVEAVADDPQREKKEDVIRQSSSAMFASGSIATVSTTNSFILAMTLYPDVQKRAQKEIDAVVKGRLPEFSDLESLPYVKAIVMEVVRWQPVVPLCFPHKLTTDDTYRNYFLPGGSVVFPNTWAILHNPKTYPDPMTFNPDRFMTPDGKAIDISVKFPDAAFGYARRVCPARAMGISSVSMAVLSVLSTFNITKALDERGLPITPPQDYTVGMLRYPKPFKTSIVPRSQEVIALIRESE